MSCVYDSPDGRQCAFRIFVRDEDAKFVNECRSEDGGDSCASHLLEVSTTILLRPEVQHLAGKLDFWDCVQDLHDMAHYWDMEHGGLTSEGQRRADFLKLIFPNA